MLDGQTLQSIGDALGVDRSTIVRDFRELDQVAAEYQRLIAEQSWVKSGLTVAEFAEEIGASPETVRAMIRDGLVEVHKQPGMKRAAIGGEDGRPSFWDSLESC